MPKPLTLSKPFPTAEGIAPDAYALRLISPAYASHQSELNAVLQYIYHSFFFKKSGYGEIAETLKSVAVAEMLHLDLLGETILALGAPPIYCRYPYSAFDFYNAKYVSYSRSLKYMLEDDLIGERHTVAEYDGMLKKLQNRQVAEIVSRIREDEILHIETLEKIYCRFKG